MEEQAMCWVYPVDGDPFMTNVSHANRLLGKAGYHDNPKMVEKERKRIASLEATKAKKAAEKEDK